MKRRRRSLPRAQGNPFFFDEFLARVRVHQFALAVAARAAAGQTRHHAIVDELEPWLPDLRTQRYVSSRYMLEQLTELFTRLGLDVAAYLPALEA